MGYSILIEDTAYPIKFGYGAFKTLAQKLGCKGVTGALKQIGELFENFENLDFEQEEFFAELLKAGVVCAGTNEKDVPITDDLLTAFLFNSENQQQVMQAISEAMPKQSGNPQPHQAAKK